LTLAMLLVQGYLTDKNSPTPLGPPQVPRHRATVVSYGGGVFLISEVPLYGCAASSLSRFLHVSTQNLTAAPNRPNRLFQILEAGTCKAIKIMVHEVLGTNNGTFECFSQQMHDVGIRRRPCQIRILEKTVWFACEGCRDRSEDRCKATWRREFKLTWREAGPLNYRDSKVDSDQ